MGEWTYSSTHS